MASLYLLIPLSLLFVAGGVALFVWAVNSGQYEDVDREAERILYDEDLESREDERAERQDRPAAGTDEEEQPDGRH